MKTVIENITEKMVNDGLLNNQTAKIINNICDEEQKKINKQKEKNKRNAISILIFSLLIASYYILPPNMRGFSRFFTCFYLLFLHNLFYPSGCRRWTIKMNLPDNNIWPYIIDNALFIIYLLWFIPNTAFFYINIIALIMFIFAHRLK